jgi:hypothetical protein
MLRISAHHNRSMKMSTKLKMAAAIALVAVIVAPGASFAQEMEFLPDQYTAGQGGTVGIPSDAYGSVIDTAQRRAPPAAARRNPAFDGAYGAAPGYSPRDYAPNYYRNENPFSSGYRGFQGQRSG